jgi:tRNA-binding EMAP/Myf-like protein
MSTFTCPVVRIGAVDKHPDADTLSTTVVEGETVVIRTGDYKEGDLAIYVPVDAVVPPTVPGTEFLGESRRIKAKRLRGVYSEGLLLPPSTFKLSGAKVEGGFNVGVDVGPVLGITKHQDKVPDNWGTSTPGLSIPSKRGLMGHFWHWCFRDQLRTHEVDPGVPLYDIESGKRYGYVLEDGEDVIITEKLHGTNCRFGGIDGKVYVGSRNHFWRDMVDRKPLLRERFGEWIRTKVLKHPGRGPAKRSLYWTVAKDYHLDTALAGRGYDGLFFYGEAFGAVQDLKYGASKGQVWFRVFDIWSVGQQRWLDWDEVVFWTLSLGLQTVPVLYRGPYSEEAVEKLVEGKSVLAQANHIREGVVVKPAEVRHAHRFGRVIVKYVSQAYKLRKGGTELQ